MHCNKQMELTLPPTQWIHLRPVRVWRLVMYCRSTVFQYLYAFVSFIDGQATMQLDASSQLVGASKDRSRRSSVPKPNKDLLCPMFWRIAKT
jgi:hypothetical protein